MHLTETRIVFIQIKRTWDEGNWSDFKRRADDNQEVHLVFILLHGSVEHFRKILPKKDNVRFHDCQRNIRTPWTMRDNLQEKCISLTLQQNTVQRKAFTLTGAACIKYE